VRIILHVLLHQSNLNFKIADRAPITFYIQLNWPKPFIFKSNNTFSLSFGCYTRIDCELFRLETVAHTAGARIITISLLHNAECNFPAIFERRAPLYIIHGWMEKVQRALALSAIDAHSIHFLLTHTLVSLLHYNKCSFNCPRKRSKHNSHQLHAYRDT
jgi:hypothetical protein